LEGNERGLEEKTGSNTGHNFKTDDFGDGRLCVEMDIESVSNGEKYHTNPDKIEVTATGKLTN
jgi:hypothetical protein